LCWNRIIAASTPLWLAGGVKPSLSAAWEEDLDQIRVVVVIDLRVHDIEADIEVWHRIPDRGSADLPNVEVRITPGQCQPLQPAEVPVLADLIGNWGPLQIMNFDVLSKLTGVRRTRAVRVKEGLL
jgi:hypothetical protein